MEKKDILKLSAHLKKGDQKAICDSTGLSNVTVNKFFNGNEESITDENINKIVVAFKTIVDARKQLAKENKKIARSI